MATQSSSPDHTSFRKLVGSENGAKDVPGGQDGPARGLERAPTNGSGISAPGKAKLHSAKPNHVRRSRNGAFDSAVGPNEPSGVPGPTSSANAEITGIDFAELTDGSLVELVEDPARPLGTLLAVWKDGKVELTDKLKHRGQVFVPVPRNVGMLARIQLPHGVRPYESVKALLGQLEGLISRCVAVDERYVAVLANFVLSTWLVDRFPVAPYLSIVGLPQSGKTTLLKLLSLVCRRSLLLADVTSAAFYQACDQLTPTLLIDEAGTAGNSRILRHMLRMGTTRDVVAVRKNGTFHSFGAKAISWLEPPDDLALSSRCIAIPMVEANRSDLIKPTDPRVERMTAQLRCQLLQFRFENYRTAHPVPIPGDEILRPRARDLLQALSAPCAEDAERCKLLLNFFESHDAIAQEPLSPPQNAVLSALFTVIHMRSNPGFIWISNLTRMVNTLLERRGERLRLEPRKVGAVLTSFGFTWRTRTNQGWSVLLANSDLERVHRLTKSYGIDRLNGPATEISFDECLLCRAAGIGSGEQPPEGLEGEFVQELVK